MSYTLFRNKFEAVVSTGEVYINYDFAKNAMEISIVSKLNPIFYEDIFGIKYSLTPRGIGLADLYQGVANKIIALEAPQLVPLINRNFEYILSSLSSGNHFLLYGQILVAIIFAVGCSALAI